jgi:hypothetical protein
MRADAARELFPDRRGWQAREEIHGHVVSERDEARMQSAEIERASARAATSHGQN